MKGAKVDIADYVHYLYIASEYDLACKEALDALEANYEEEHIPCYTCDRKQSCDLFNDEKPFSKYDCTAVKYAIYQNHELIRNKMAQCGHYEQLVSEILNEHGQHIDENIRTSFPTERFQHFIAFLKKLDVEFSTVYHDTLKKASKQMKKVKLGYLQCLSEERKGDYLALVQ